MTKQEFLSASLPYELKVYYDGRARELHGIVDDQIYVDYNGIGTLMEGIEDVRITPIVRSLDDLTKPIVQVDYNNGEPFMPIVELLKPNIDLNGAEFYWIETCICVKGSVGGFGGTILSIENPCLSLNQFQLLLKWHFWPDMPGGEEVVYVTDEFNPYK